MRRTGDELFEEPSGTICRLILFQEELLSVLVDVKTKGYREYVHNCQPTSAPGPIENWAC